ncbi:MAG TPA: bifunctional fucokinase/L-fucose-1-P-guanylyltransferase [Ruminococcaceae bacterium]|nr:bifunctional fucokinase/L-fucose-1-P-guanylyltransferase [Oscillospiraceae bacterium]
MSDNVFSNKLTNTAMISLFLQQSLMDSQADFERSVSNPNFPHWDCIVITASNTAQADGYRKQIEYRRSVGRVSPYTDFLVVSDRDNKRVGSAGSTLSVIRELKQKFNDLSDKRIMVIHAGGNSSRTPQYSALGKLFSPIPTTFGGLPATLFDMFMISMASIPGRLKNGMLLLSGDVTLLFNPLMCDFGSSDAAVISFKEDTEIAKNHGVYLKSDSGNVKKFLHKKPVEILQSEGAVDERGKCSIDTGALWLSPKILEAMYTTVDTEEKYDAMVNDKARLSLYGDISYCLSEDSTLEDFYSQTPEGGFCDELTMARTALWNAIGQYNMKLLNLSPARFIHFGSIPEIMKLMDKGVEEYSSLGWKKQTNSSLSDPSVAAYNSVLSDGAAIGDGAYFEVSYIHSKAVVGKNSYISFIDLHDETIPDNVLIHGLKQNDGNFVCRIMGIHDNPKSNCIFGQKIEDLIEKLGIDRRNIWNDNEEHTLWTASLYPECKTVKMAVDTSLELYNLLVNGFGDKDKWLKANRKSLCSGFNDADPDAIIDWTKRMEELVRMDEFKKCILEGKPASECSSILNSKSLTRIQNQWLDKELKKIDISNLADFSYAIRLYYYLGTVLNDEHYISRSFQLIADTVLNSTMNGLKYNNNCHIVTDEAVVKLPLRVNWGGGWTDTCPHCLEHGGVVLNAAISLNGELPVEVRLVKISEHKIVFDSRDMDVHGEFGSIEPLQNTGDPFDPFALQKACLLACGILPASGGNLDTILERLGGGFEMHSEVTNVPKGSGLGTSSILSAATVKAVFEFTGIEYDDDKLYSTVLSMEQIMSTGGGWQDQVGGVTPGIKFITSQPGLEQKINVEHIQLSEKTKKELSERFAVIYTGQRRLARNLLRDVVGSYVGNEPRSLKAHRDIQKVAALMRFALERGDIDEFASLLNEHWGLSKMIDSGSTNTLIDQIIMAIDDLADAKMICGAGGGGFLQIILKKGISKNDIHRRLKDVFQDFDVDIWRSDFVF